MGLLPLTELGIQRPQAAVAVGLERPHPQLVGQGEGLAIVIFGPVPLRRFVLRRNVAEEAQGIGLVTPLLARRGKGEGLPGEVMGLLDVSSQQPGLAQPRETNRLLPHGAELQALFQQRDGPVEVPFAEVDPADAEIGIDQREGVRDGLGHVDGLFADAEALRERALLTEAPG
jgi:hypothetical protein